MKYAKLISILMVSSFLTACGGGGGGGSDGGGGGGGNPPANQAPTISVDASVNATANTEITITATASDSDGQIDSYSWEVTSSQSITLSGADTSSVTFTTPDVNSTENVTLSLTVSDDDGATATSTVTVVVSPEGTEPPPTEATTLTLQGEVLDNANISTITVLLDGEEFPATVEMTTATTYEASVDVEGAERESFLSIKGEGDSANSHVVMISLVGKVNDLITQAQDAVLTSSENFAVNLSSLSTAKYGLIKRVNGTTNVHSDTAVETGMSSLGTIALQNWASAVLVAAADGDASGTLMLPANIDSTLELVESPDAMAAYLGNVFYSGEFEDAKSGLLINTNYYALVDRLGESFTLYFNPQDGLNFSVSPTAGLSHSMVFNADRTGTMNQYSFDWDFTSISGGGNDAIVAVFDDNGHAESKASDGETVIKSGISKMAIVLVDQPADQRANFVVTTEFERITGTADPEVTRIDRVLANASMATTTMPELSETVFVTLPRNRFSQQFILVNTNTFGKATQYEEIQLNSDGTGSAVFTGQDITWSRSGDELSITGLNYYNEEDDFYTPADTISYKVVSNRNLHQVVSTTVKKEGETEHNLISTGSAVLDGNEVAWTTESTPGFYVGNFRAATSRPLDSFFVELKENNDADVYYTTDENNDGVLVETNDNATEVTHLYGKWEITSDGSLKISTFTLSGLETDPSCRAEDSTTGCKVYEERTWRKVAESGNQMMVTNKRYFNWTNRSPLEPDVETNSLVSLTKSETKPVPVTKL